MRRGSVARAFTGIVTITIFTSCAVERDAATDWGVSVDTLDGLVRVTNTPPAGGATPGMTAVEELRIGTVAGEGPASFGLIRSIAVLADGRIAVAEGQAQEVRLFNREGEHLRTFGGQGAGPGELDGMQGVFVDHEGLLRVAEQRNARLSVFDPDSGFVGSFPVQLFSYGVRGPWEAAIDASGQTVVASSGTYGEGRFWNMLRVYDPEMTQLDSIPYYEYTNDGMDDEPPGVWRITVGNGWMYMPVPFFPRSWQALTSSGEFWTSAQGADRLEVARWRPPGDTSLVLVSHRPAEAVSPSERDSAMAATRERLAERLSGAPSLSASRVPATKPPVYSLSFDDRGRLWARITGPTGETTAYDIFTGDGVYAESVALPFRVDDWISPLVRGDTVWAVVVDEVDVQHVVRARLTRPDLVR